MIERLENISQDRLKIYESNSEFFKTFPITICAENVEVDYLNENVVARGMLSNTTIYHVRLTNRNSYEVVRSFYQNGEVFCLYFKDKIQIGTLINVSEDHNVFTILFKGDKSATKLEGPDLNRIFPVTYYFSEIINIQSNSNEIITFCSGKNTVRLRLGQRSFFILYLFL